MVQLHWPGFPILNNWATNSFVKGLAQVQREGLAEAVGVSNFKAERVREANRIMKARLQADSVSCRLENPRKVLGLETSLDAACLGAQG